MKYDKITTEGWYWWRQTDTDEWCVRQVLFRANEWRGYDGEENSPVAVMGGDFILIAPPAP